MKRSSCAVALASLALLVACTSGTAATPRSSPSESVAPQPTVAPSPSPTAPQRQEPSLPSPIEETAAAAAGGQLYVMGGFNAAGASLDGVFVFDGASWQAGPPLPLPLDHPSATSLGGQVYIAGGHSNGRDSARLFRLDGSRWTELARMHFARGGHALLAEGGTLYAIGGNSNAGNVAAVEAYDPAGNAWTVVSQLPAPRNHVSGIVLGSRVCVAAGRSPATVRVDCFDTYSGAWSRLADLPRPTSGGGAATLANGDVVMMGGQDAGESALVDMVTHFSAGVGWTNPASMLTPRHGFELAVFQGRAWACGGATAPGLHPVAVCTSVGPV